MRVKMYQRHFAEMFRVGAQQRRGVTKWSPPPKESIKALQTAVFQRTPVIFAFISRASPNAHTQIAAVHDVQALAHVKIPRNGDVPGRAVDT